jgi:hypothetical protein
MDCTRARHDCQVAEIPEDPLKKPQHPARNSTFVGVKNQEKIAPNSTASKKKKEKRSQISLLHLKEKITTTRQGKQKMKKQTEE